MRFYSLVVIFILIPSTLWAYKVPSSVSLSQSFDNDKNRSTNLALDVSTKPGAIIRLDYTNSYYEFDEDNKGNFSTVGLGLGTNPLNDLVFNVDYSYSVVSDQLAVADPSMSLKGFWGNWDTELTVCYRIIEIKITEEFRNLFSGVTAQQVTDENYWWSLSLGRSFGRFYAYLKYSQYQYSRSFGFFSRNIATLLGYDLDTISYGTSLIDFSGKIGISYSLNRWGFNLDYSRLENEFEEGSVRVLVPSVNFQLNKSWSFDANLGLTRGVAEDEEDTIGRFLGLGVTYFW
ncbi:MAG: hypothetical protein HRT44_07710 [Bdellovibrionales bacterium]|nr:hypothetical protein [Bdellovibrionales bacterium]NQZ19124.1 hypothetical protein [Bdellovibrionales bacterium]